MGGIADGVQQVRLAQPHAAVEEKRVVSAGRVFRHGHAGGVGQAVAGADDEILKGVARVDRPIGWARGGIGRDFRRGRLDFDIVEVLVPDDEAHRLGLAHQPGQQARDGAGKAAFQPISGISILDAYKEGTVLM